VVQVFRGIGLHKENFMARNGANRLNKGYVGVNKFASTTEGIINARNDYLNKVQNTVSLDGLSASFVLDFTGPTSDWLPYLNFSRGISASFFGTSGYVTYADSNVPRIEYDKFGNTLGLLIEEPVRQAVTWSEDMSNAAWGKQGLTGLTEGVAYNVALAPDGTTTATMLIPSSVVGGNKALTRLYGIGGRIGYPVTQSIFVKKAGNTYPAIRYLAQFSTANPVEDSILFVVDLNDGSISNVSYSGNAQGLNVRADFSYGIEKYPNDWYRVYASARPISSNRLQGVWPLKGVTAPINQLGDNVSGVLVWGGQATMTSGPRSYKKTFGSVINMPSDDCIIQGNSFSSWFKTNGSFYVEFYNKEDYFNAPSDTNPTPAAGNMTVFSTQYSYQKILNLANIELNGNDNLALQITGDSLISTKGYTAYQQLNKAAITFTGTGSTYYIDFSLNGSNPQSITTSDFKPDLVRWMTIGSCGLTGTVGSGFFGHYNGIIRKINFYETPLTKDQMRAITSA
jgi:hypothetical protein